MMDYRLDPTDDGELRICFNLSSLSWPITDEEFAEIDTIADEIEKRNSKMVVTIWFENRERNYKY